MPSLTKIEGVGAFNARKLQAAGIRSTNALLDKGASRKGRKEIAQNSGLSEKLVLRWVNHADLFRVKGVGEQYAELLEAAGVDTVIELAKRSPQNLVDKMTKVNQQKRLVRKLPTTDQVSAWVKQAKKLPRKVSH